MQKSTALSTAEAENYSASTAAAEVNLLEHIGFAQRVQTSIFEHNNAYIEWGNIVIGGLSRELAKHIDNSKHFAHEAIQHVHM
jgi:hypothetical protein